MAINTDGTTYDSVDEFFEVMDGMYERGMMKIDDMPYPDKFREYLAEKKDPKESVVSENPSDDDGVDTGFRLKFAPDGLEKSLEESVEDFGKKAKFKAGDLVLAAEHAEDDTERTHLTNADLANDDGDYSVGDVAGVTNGGGFFDIGDEVTIKELDGDGTPWAERNSDGTRYFVNIARLERVSKAVEETEFEVGDKVIALEDGLDITEGNTYEIIETYPTFKKYTFFGDIRITDDEGDGHDVRSEKFKKADSSDSNDFQDGDIVYVKEVFTDATADTAEKGIAEVSNSVFSDTQYILQNGNRITIYFVEGADDHRDKLTLVCRAEDRLDTEKF